MASTPFTSIANLRNSMVILEVESVDWLLYPSYGKGLSIQYLLLAGFRFCIPCRFDMGSFTKQLY